MPCYTLKKEERICKKKEIEQLFSEESHSMMAFPVRAVYLLKEREEGSPNLKMMVSVPKKCFKRAVKRNRVKRQIREAYRLLKHSLTEMLHQQENKTLLVAFVWTDKKLYPSSEVNKRIEKLLCHLSEVVTPQCAKQ